MLRIIIIAVFLGATNAMQVQYKDCGSKLGNGITVTVDPCTAEPCTLTRGMNYSIGIDFTASSADQKISAVIHGIVAGVPVPFPFDHPDACVDSGLTCPLSAGKKYHYSATLPVLTSYPAIKLLVQWELKDDKQAADITCVEIPVAVVSSEWKNKLHGRL